MTFEVIQGDCLEVMSLFLADNSVDAIVCDPPYGLNFMGKKWDYDVPGVEIWRECLRVLKPGGYLLAFAGTRTQHRMAVNIEDAGFEIRDMIAWVYGSGFPKNKNLGDGFGSALKPALEPLTMARKPFSGTLEKNWSEHGVGGLNIDGCRVATDNKLGGGRLTGATKVGDGWDRPWMNDPDRRNADAQSMREKVAKAEELGRFPANLIHDGSEEVVALFPDSNGSGGSVPNVKISGYGDGAVGTGKSEYLGGERTKVDCGSGSAARFFYAAKASKKDRGENNTHPTVKPTDLMCYLCRLITPTGGLVLDPFMGSGSTGKAAIREGFRFIGIEREAEYLEIAKTRITAALKAAA